MGSPTPERLGDFRYLPGTKVTVAEGGTPLMVIELCPGMIRDCSPSGGRETVAVVSMETGRTAFWHESTKVRRTIQPSETPNG